MTEVFRQICSALAASLSLVFLLYFTDYVFWFDLMMSAAIGLGTWFSIPRKKEDHETEIAPGVSKARLKEAIRRINEYVAEFSQLSSQTRNSGIQKQIAEITGTLTRTGRILWENPAELDSTAAQLFLDQFLKRSCDVVSQYVRMCSTADNADKTETAKKAIAEIQSGFNGFYRRCLEKDMTELETEVEILKAISEMDFPDTERNRT